MFTRKFANRQFQTKTPFAVATGAEILGATVTDGVWTTFNPSNVPGIDSEDFIYTYSADHYLQYVGKRSIRANVIWTGTVASSIAYTDRSINLKLERQRSASFQIVPGSYQDKTISGNSHNDLFRVEGEIDLIELDLIRPKYKTGVVLNNATWAGMSITDSTFKIHVIKYLD